MLAVRFQLGLCSCDVFIEQPLERGAVGGVQRICKDEQIGRFILFCLEDGVRQLGGVCADFCFEADVDVVFTQDRGDQVKARIQLRGVRFAFTD